MTKKIIAIAALMTVLGGDIFAQEKKAPERKKLALSAGAGGFFGGDLGGGVKLSDGGAYKTPFLGGGAFFFFDARYVEVSLGVFAGGGTLEYPRRFDDEFRTIINTNIGLLGKYPFTINEKLMIFPLLGAEYNICSLIKVDGQSYPINKEFSALWFKAGVGLDFAVSQKLYLRLEAMYGVRLQNKAEKNEINRVKEWNKDADPLFGHGPTAKIALGYIF